MTLSPKILANIYVMLVSCKPFSGYRSMPPVEFVKFSVTQDAEAFGTYQYDEDAEYPHKIEISKALCKHLSTVINTMSHEMVHLKYHRSHDWDLHGDKFNSSIEEVAVELGVELDSLL
jgi:hypothetical protein